MPAKKPVGVAPPSRTTGRSLHSGVRYRDELLLLPESHDVVRHARAGMDDQPRAAKDLR
jgi:hypothetical protein